MADPHVVAVGRSGEQVLSEDVTVLHAQQLVLSVTGSRTRSLSMDGRDHRLSSGATGLLAVDLSRSTGYHRIEVDGHTFWLATEDGKLSLDGIARMLEELRSMGTGWSGQVIHSDGTGYRDPHVIYAWLDEHAQAVTSSIRTVLMSPRSEMRTTQGLSRRGGASVLTVPTLRYLRTAPTRLLEQRVDGVMQIGQSRYDPQRVVVRRRRTTLDTVPNRRAVQVLDTLARLLQEVLQAPLDATSRTRLRLRLYEVESLQQRSVARSLRTGTNVMSSPRVGVEHTEPPYRAVFAASRDLLNGFGWNPLQDPARRYSYVQYADQIYQAYSVSRLASALGLTQNSAVLGSASPAFSGPDYDLYYDTPPVATVLRSWRAATAVPDSSRPDAMLVEKSTGRVAILDAKYRIAGDGWATEDSRKEVAAYTSLYGVPRVGILFPGDGSHARSIEASGQAILEVPVSPGTSAVDTSTAELLSLLHHGPYTSQ